MKRRGFLTGLLKGTAAALAPSLLLPTKTDETFEFTFGRLSPKIEIPLDHLPLSIPFDGTGNTIPLLRKFRMPIYDDDNCSPPAWAVKFYTRTRHLF